MFDPAKCTGCCICLEKCPAVQYDAEKAQHEISALKQGARADILSACSTCMACNEYCPSGAGPFYRIIELQERYGIGMVSEDRAETIEAMLGSVPKRIIAGDAGRPALSLCVMEHAFPANMAGSTLFEGLTVVSGSPYYSRVVHLHTGLPSVTKAYAAAFIGSLSALGRQKIVFAHDDCYVMAAVLAPAYGIEVPFEVVHLADWLAEALAQRCPDVRTLGKKAAFQRPCIARLAPWTDRFVDRVFRLAGVERVARIHDRLNALCCGIGLAEKSSAASTDLAARNIADALQHGAQAMVFGCPSCYAFMSRACMTAGLAPIFIADLARMAMGELPFEPRPHMKKQAA
jgi:Fe-S oxidoreductase